MKKIFLIITPFVFLSTLSAQITREEADEIVLERMSREIPPYTVYAQENIQTNMVITTSAEEVIELDYACWAYYINYADNANCYLMVNESNGNLLEINTKSDVGTSNLSEWREVIQIKIPYKECTHEDAGFYMDTIQMTGIGYLFINSIPVELQKDNDVIYIIYNKEDHSATFSATYTNDASYSGNICNFPDFAKEWEISFEGKQIYYKGELHVAGMYTSWPPHIWGDLIFTTLK